MCTQPSCATHYAVSVKTRSRCLLTRALSSSPIGQSPDAENSSVLRVIQDYLRDISSPGLVETEGPPTVTESTESRTLSDSESCLSQLELVKLLGLM